jgi:glucokinase
MEYFLGLDIGGTSLKLGAWEDERRLAWQDGIRVPDSTDAVAVLDEVARAVRAFAVNLPQTPLALGVGSCGLIRGGVIYQSPNTAWDELPVEALLEQRLGWPVYLLNDADAFLLSVLGGHTEVESAIGLTLGTGLGTAVWLDRRLICGGSGISPEGGHITLNVDGPPANTGIPGTWEALACKESLLRYYAEGGGKTAQDPAAVAEEAARGMVVARTAWTRYGQFLGAGLGSLCNIFSPEHVFIGGGLSGAYAWFENAMRAAMEKHMLRVLPRPAVSFVADRPDAVAHGAARYASMLLQDD